jgi:hypothetical protein
MRERFGTAFILVEIAVATVLSCFGLIGMLALISAHKSAKIVALDGVLSVSLVMLFMGLMAGAMWIGFRRAVWYRSSI